jgi:hypothetical protein
MHRVGAETLSRIHFESDAEAVPVTVRRTLIRVLRASLHPPCARMPHGESPREYFKRVDACLRNRSAGAGQLGSF